MDISQFRAGNWQKILGYKAFVPELINHAFVWRDDELNELLEKASRQIGALDVLANYVPDVDQFIRAYEYKEAVVSSRIEGTQTQLDEAFQREQDIDPEKHDDWVEVNNYVTAMNGALSDLNRLPLSSRLLRAAHARLLQSGRGKHKSPGEFRTSQNWIGGATLADATFVPPPAAEVARLMGDLEQFLHNEELRIPHLIRVAIAHYQFETIHPFLDGNGRLGRLLITLYLVDQKVLTRPLLYLSDFFDKHRTLYFDNLMRVRLQNDLRQWLRFFLVAVEETSRRAIEALRAIIELKERRRDSVMTLGRRAGTGQKLLTHLFSQPVVRVQDVEILLSTNKKTAGELVAALVGLGILVEMTGQRRNRLFVFDEYLKLFA